MGPDPDQPSKVQRLHGSDGLTDAPHPPGHLTGAVDVVRLHVLSETLLHGHRTKHCLQVGTKSILYIKKNLYCFDPAHFIISKREKRKRVNQKYVFFF